jgi:hypothetical protein
MTSLFCTPTILRIVRKTKLDVCLGSKALLAEHRNPENRVKKRVAIRFLLIPKRGKVPVRAFGVRSELTLFDDIQSKDSLLSQSPVVCTLLSGLSSN